MSEKKLRRVLTSAAVAASLFLTAAAGASAAEPHARRTQVRGGQIHSNPGDSRPFSLWKFLVGVWEKRGVGMDPEGHVVSLTADWDATTPESRSDIDQGGR